MFFLGLLIVLFTRVLWALKVDLFIDEGFSSVVVRQPVVDMMQTVAADYNTFLHYSYIKAWGIVFGESDISLRLSSLFVSLLILFVFYKLTLFFFRHKHFRQVATVLFAVIPSILYYSFDVRMYGFVQLWFLVSIYYVCKAIVEKFTWRDVLFFSGSLIAGFYSHELFGLHIVLLGIYVIVWMHRLSLQMFLTSFGITALAVIYWLPIMFLQIKDKASEGWLIFQYWGSFTETQFQLFMFPVLFRNAHVWQIILISILSVAAIVGLYKAKIKQAYFLLFVLLGTHILFFCISPKLPLYFYRYILHIVPLYVIGLVLFVQHIKQISDSKKIGVVSLLILLCIFWALPARSINLPVRGALPYLEQFHYQGYELVFEGPFTYFPAEFYLAPKGIHVWIYQSPDSMKKYLGRSGIEWNHYLMVMDPHKKYLLVRDPYKDLYKYQLKPEDRITRFGRLLLIEIN